MSILHTDIRPDANANKGNHVLHNFTFANTTDMAASNDSIRGAVVLGATDIGKVAQVGAAAPYDFYVLTNHVGPVWVKMTNATLQAAYSAGRTIATDATGAVAIQYKNANAEHTALRVELQDPATQFLGAGQPLATLDYSPTVLRFGRVLTVKGQNMKENLMLMSRDSGAKLMEVDPAGFFPGGTLNYSFRIQPTAPTTVAQNGIDVAIQGGESHPDGTDGGAAVLQGGQTGPGSTSGTGGPAVVQAGQGVGAGTLGGSVLINAGAADDGFASYGSILIGGSSTLSITLGNLVDNPSITALHRIDVNPQVTGANPNQYAQELAFTGTGLQSVGVFLSEVSPEGIIAASPGSICHVNYPAANANNGVWVKRSGAGNTGWRQLVDSDTLSQPASRTISGISDTPSASDIGNVCHVSQAGACTITVPDLSASLISGREIRLSFQAEGAGTAMTFHCGVGVNINGAGADYVAAVGRTRVILLSRDGLNYFTG